MFRRIILRFIGVGILISILYMLQNIRQITYIIVVFVVLVFLVVQFSKIIEKTKERRELKRISIEFDEYSKLTGIDFRNIDLTLIDLSKEELRKGNFQGLDLRDCNLSGLNLEGANLRNTNLSNMDLTNTNLNYADLSFSNMEYCNLEDSEFFGALFENTNLNGALMKSCELSNNIFRNVNFKEVEIDSMNRVLFIDCNFEGVDFNNIFYIRKSIFLKCNFKNAIKTKIWDSFLIDCDTNITEWDDKDNLAFSVEELEVFLSTPFMSLNSSFREICSNYINERKIVKNDIN